MPWVPAGPVDDMTLARLPYPTAQLLLVGQPVPHSAVVTDVEWHGTSSSGDPEVGSFAMVREGGPLEDLVGERLRITRGRKSVYAYCHRTADLDDDVSVTRTLFARLGLLSATSLPVVVEVLA